jgi:hypothetical protein
LKNYKVDFHIESDDIYISLTNNMKGNVVLYEKVTEQVVPVVKEHLDKNEI